MRPRPAISDLTDHLGYWLRLVSNHVSLAFARRLEGLGVSVAEWVMLRRLHGTDALAPSRLADEMGMTRGAISKLAERLEAKGLIARAANPQDARAHTLALTDAGTALVPELARCADDNDAAFFASLTADERRQLASILKAIAARHALRGTPLA